MGDIEQRVAAFRERFEAEIEEWALGVSIAGAITGKPVPLVQAARGMRVYQPGPREGVLEHKRTYYAGLAETPDGGWEPTIFIHESFRPATPIEQVYCTVRIS